MGNCLGIDVESKYETGKAHADESHRHAAEEAACLLYGSMSYCTWILLYLECRSLKDADVFSKSDPVGILYEKKEGGHWVEAGRTEMVANSLNPKFVEPFKVLFNFERRQEFKLVIVDIDKGQDPRTVSPDSCGFLGGCEFQLSEVITASGKKLQRSLRKRDRQTKPCKSTALLVAEEETTSKDVYRVTLAAANLKNPETLGRLDPFLQISRMQDDGTTLLPVYKTNVRMNNVCPTWDEIVVRSTQLNNGDKLRPLRLQVFDHKASGAHRLLGQCDLSTERMQQHGASGGVVALQPPPGKPPGDYGTLQVVSFSVQQQPTFVDYLAGGTEIGFMVAVDFTASNGDPRLPESKHYYAAGPTQYERAIMGVGHVLEHYDHDKVFQAYGFGGRHRNNPANHCFPMGTLPDSNCIGINGLLQAYRQALGIWTLSGPTLFAPVVRKAAAAARATVGSKPPKYTVLLILTDGAIMDMEDTVNAIIEASSLPLSILIVGIGNEDFGKMDKLDSDRSLLSNGVHRAARDIVQFVEFEKHAGDGARLAAQLLAELPGQLLGYMRTNNVHCPPPLTTSPTMGRCPTPMSPEAPEPTATPLSPAEKGACMSSAAAVLPTGGVMPAPPPPPAPPPVARLSPEAPPPAPLPPAKPQDVPLPPSAFAMRGTPFTYPSAYPSPPQLPSVNPVLGQPVTYNGVPCYGGKS
ncbi:hypothetical protein Agub_g1901 [Astrephomene gubernaculifera]|uniref:C2 domain-containing protein n=1 Tax=Astrephomene gubernaculifera TaxID=47775 RepID=A0AAD3DIC1_9CHLO|nr:hypothetical protein Agub_g1901 [Astrephomene gubernaculifera]